MACTKSVRKVNETGIEIIVTPNKQDGFLFKIISLKSNALFHLSLLFFYALLERFFLDTPWLCHYNPLDSIYTFKTGPLDDPSPHPLVLGWGEKSLMVQDQVNRGCSGMVRLFLARNSWILKTLWTVALSRWSSHKSVEKCSGCRKLILVLCSRDMLLIPLLPIAHAACPVLCLFIQALYVVE